MDRDFADIPHPPIPQAFFLQPFQITEINEHGADRLRVDRPRRRESECAGKQIGFVIISGHGMPVIGGAKRCRQILPAPGEADQPIRHIANIAFKRHKRTGRFRRHAEDFGCPLINAFPRFQRREKIAKPIDIRR